MHVTHEEMQDFAENVAIWMRETGGVNCPEDFFLRQDMCDMCVRIIPWLEGQPNLAIHIQNSCPCVTYGTAARLRLGYQLARQDYLDVSFENILGQHDAGQLSMMLRRTGLLPDDVHQIVSKLHNTTVDDVARLTHYKRHLEYQAQTWQPWGLYKLMIAYLKKLHQLATTYC